MTEPQPTDHQPRTPGRGVSKKVSILLMHERLTEEQIRERLLSDVSEERKEPKWCPFSEARLLQLMVNFKPVGVKKFWNLFSIHKYMHHIHAYESGVNMFLNDINVKSYASILHCAPEDREERYEPIYSIRPTISQILEKVSTGYNLALAEHCEELPPEYTEESDFALPESFFVESRSSYRTTASRSLDISVCGKKGGASQASSSGYSITSGTRRSCNCSRSCKCATRATKVSSEERRFASPLTTASIVSEKETVNQFFYTVTKGNRRCTIPGKMYSKRLPDSWVHINFVLFDEDGSELLNLNTDIMQEALRNTFVNGKPVTFVQ